MTRTPIGGLVATLAAIAALAGCGGDDAADGRAGAGGARVTATVPPTTTAPATTARRPEPRRLPRRARRPLELGTVLRRHRRRRLRPRPGRPRRGRWGADPDRVYATGASNGAAMSYRLAAALPGVFAAIAPVSGALTDIDVPEGFPTGPVSLVAFHGRQDGVFATMDQGVAAWRRAGCGTPQATPYGGSGQLTRSAARCRDGTEVVVYEPATMGHAWPGAATDDPMAAPDAPATANDLLWEFFDRHPRRR